MWRNWVKVFRQAKKVLTATNINQNIVFLVEFVECLCLLFTWVVWTPKLRFCLFHAVNFSIVWVSAFHWYYFSFQESNCSKFSFVVASTISEQAKQLTNAVVIMKSANPASLTSTSSGCELFMRFISNIRDERRDEVGCSPPCFD